MTDTAIDKVLRPYERQAKRVLPWCFKTIAPTRPETIDQVRWHLEAIGINPDGANCPRS